MILLSAVNVYLNEIYYVLAPIPGVLECAAVGVSDDKTGEAVIIVDREERPLLTEAQVREYFMS